jgi:serine/threonine protein kinase
LTRNSVITDLTDRLRSSQDVSTSPISQGGFADVYQAILDGTRFAVKCLRIHDIQHVEVYPVLPRRPPALTFNQRTARQLNMWSKLEHENILEPTGLALFHGHLAMVSPWMNPGSANTMLKNLPATDRYSLVRQSCIDKPRPQSSSCSITQCKQLTAGVEYMHRWNIVCLITCLAGQMLMIYSATGTRRY